MARKRRETDEKGIKKPRKPVSGENYQKVYLLIVNTGKEKPETEPGSVNQKNSVV